MQATTAEVELALSKQVELVGGAVTFNNYDYIKRHEDRLPGLYAGTMAHIHKYKDVFSTNKNDRQTINIKPIPFGIKPECRHTITNRRSQFQLAPRERLAMICRTLISDKNGLYVPDTGSRHQIPYSMIPKKDGRLREVYNLQQLNAIVEERPTDVPVMPQVNRFYGRNGLYTAADWTNFYDGLPAPKEDWPWVTIQTPLGRRQMTCWSYGHKNATAAGQFVSSTICAEVEVDFPGSMLVYIDDTGLHHGPDWDTQQHLDHLEKYLTTCRKYRVLNNPSKFWPFVDEIETVGIQYSQLCHQPTIKYKHKIAIIVLPMTQKELMMFTGILQYIAKYIFQFAHLTYYLNLLIKDCNKRNSKEIQWTEEAKEAFNELKYRIEKCQVLFHYQEHGGILCLQHDACDHAGGSVSPGV